VLSSEMTPLITRFPSYSLSERFRRLIANIFGGIVVVGTPLV